MCGIVACRSRDDVLGFLLDGLSRLEYRGYDSAGVALLSGDGGSLQVVRQVGRMAALRRRVADRDLPGRLGIGHTRWATHGPVNESNAHPHQDCTRRVALVHNGIIENAVELRQDLISRGHAFRSDVDSEVVAHLVEQALDDGQDFRPAVRLALAQLHGSWALAVLLAGQDRLILAAQRSPLVVAQGPLGFFVASDMTPLLPHAETVHVLGDGDVVEVGPELVWLSAAGEEVPVPPPVHTGWQILDVERGQYDDFMEKEIAEQFELTATASARLTEQVLDGSLLHALSLRRFDRLRFVGCGTSLNAAGAVARVARVLGNYPTQQVIASESEEYVDEQGALTIAFSQSGETADVLAALDGCHAPVLAITNAPYSSLARRADAVIDIAAGPEIGVAATKTFTGQVLAGAAFLLAALAEHGRLDPQELLSQLGAFRRIPDALRDAHLLAEPVADALVGDLTEAPGFLFVSRGAGLPYAAEGALKLKEITYRWAECCPAGELKHGPIALIEQGTPVVVIDGGRPAKLAANISEMQARGARVIRIGRSPDATFPVLSPVEQAWGPIESVLPLQHLARSLAVRLGRDADKPRNLAKSVTVD